jgi:hypothetical protein
MAGVGRICISKRLHFYYHWEFGPKRHRTPFMSLGPASFITPFYLTQTSGIQQQIDQCLLENLFPNEW